LVFVDLPRDSSGTITSNVSIGYPNQAMLGKVLQRIEPRRDSAASPDVAVRSVTYDYYNGEGADSDHGRLGDLKLAIIRVGAISGSTIDHTYYRYYTQWGYSRSGDPSPTGNIATMGGTDTTFTRNTTAWNDPYFNIFQPADNTVYSGLGSVGGTLCSNWRYGNSRDQGRSL